MPLLPDPNILAQNGGGDPLARGRELLQQFGPGGGGGGGGLLPPMRPNVNSGPMPEPVQPPISIEEMQILQQMGIPQEQWAQALFWLRNQPPPPPQAPPPPQLGMPNMGANPTNMPAPTPMPMVPMRYPGS